MISLDTAVHVVAVVVAIALVGGVQLIGLVPETDTAMVALLFVFYGFVLGGSHLVLALAGKDGLVPVASRWRYVATLAILFAIGAAVVVAGDGAIWGLEIGTIGLGAVVVTLVAYLYVESSDGYRSAVSDPE